MINAFPFVAYSGQITEITSFRKRKTHFCACDGDFKERKTRGFLEELYF